MNEIDWAYYFYRCSKYFNYEYFLVLAYFASSDDNILFYVTPAFYVYIYIVVQNYSEV